MGNVLCQPGKGGNWVEGDVNWVEGCFCSDSAENPIAVGSCSATVHWSSHEKRIAALVVICSLYERQ